MLKQKRRSTIRLSSRLQRRRGAGGGSRSRRRYGAPKSRSKRGIRAGVISPQSAAEKQHGDARYLAAIKDFEAAARFFQKRKFDKAKEIFEKLAGSTPREVAARARVHLQLCQRKLNSAGRVSAPKTAEDYYNLAVVALNARALDAAVEHLAKADKLAPNQEHIRYVLAAAHALQGNTDAALDHLRAAIELRPENRVRARRDEDFQPLVANPRFRQLVNS